MPETSPLAAERPSRRKPNNSLPVTLQSRLGLNGNELAVLLRLVVWERLAKEQVCALAVRGHDLRPTLHRSLGIIRAVLDAREGERNKLLFWATCRAREMVVGDELDHDAGVQVLEALRAAGAEAGLTQREIDRTITSAMRAA